MNPKKPKHLKSVHAGISLEPQLTARARAKAKAEGYASLSAYVRYVLTQALNNAADTVERLGEQNKKAAKAKLRPRPKVK